jgi:hypothetical protein
MHRIEFDDATYKNVEALLDEFVAVVKDEVKSANLRPAVVRAMFQCNILIVLDTVHLWIAAEKQQPGMGSTLGIDHRSLTLSIEDVYDAARWEYGFDQPFVIQFPVSLLGQDPATRHLAVAAVAQSHVQAERERVRHQMNMIQINPIFGPASYAVDPRLAFILMPFKPDLTEIYHTFIKPTVEGPEFGLVCRRADDVKSNKAIIQDIWKSICEARLIIADMTGLNANVMYELGIAHTLGKETILIYQRGEDVRFPFDLAHIRRIEYDNNATGGRRLEEELHATLSSIVNPSARA